MNPASVQGVCGALLERNFCGYAFPKAIYYWATGEWQGADDEVVKVVNEAIKKDKMRYLKWTFQQTRWVFCGLSENPTEWQQNFHATIIDRAKNPFQLSLTRGLIETKPIPGLSEYWPGIIKIYDPLRTIYSKTATYAKKIATVSMPFLFFMVWRWKTKTSAVFLTLAMIVHVATGISLAMIVGFQHRYAVALEVFDIIYLMYWFD